MAKDWIYKNSDGNFQYSGAIENIVVTTPDELDAIATSDNAQLGVVLNGKSGYELYARLPGGTWIPDTAEA